MLLSERERIETIEKQMLFQQKQWNDVWAEAHQDELAQFKEESAKIYSELSKLRGGNVAAEPVLAAPEAAGEPEVPDLSSNPVLPVLLQLPVLPKLVRPRHYLLEVWTTRNIFWRIPL